MKAFFKFIKSLITPDKTCECVEATEEKSPTILIGWNIQGEGVHSVLVNGDATISYKASTNTIMVLDQETTITTRVFTKVNNILKKGGIDVVSKETFGDWEQKINSKPL